jgi:hypothetical protein
MPKCYACSYCKPSTIPFIGKCQRILDKAKVEPNLLRKFVYLWAGSLVFIADDEPCKSADVYDGSV